MPTISPSQSGSSDPEPHKARQMAESFGTDTQRYDRARPRYPESMVTSIVDGIPGPDILNVGCGTGIEARQFQMAECKVLGIEPDARMAEFAKRSGVAVEIATFEAWDPAGRTFDALVSGTAWHWVDPMAGAVKAAKVLRRGGILALFWNVFQLPTEIATAFSSIYRQVAPDSPVDIGVALNVMDAYQERFNQVANGISQVVGFSDIKQSRFDWELSYTRSEWLDVLPTQGLLTQLPADKLAEVAESVGDAIGAMGGRFTLPYATVAVTGVRNDSAS